MRRKKIKPINIVALKLIIISILFDAETVKADNYPSQNGWFGAYIFPSQDQINYVFHELDTYCRHESGDEQCKNIKDDSMISCGSNQTIVVDCINSLFKSENKTKLAAALQNNNPLTPDQQVFAAECAKRLEDCQKKFLKGKEKMIKEEKEAVDISLPYKEDLFKSLKCAYSYNMAYRQADLRGYWDVMFRLLEMCIKAMKYCTYGDKSVSTNPFDPTKNFGCANEDDLIEGVTYLWSLAVRDKTQIGKYLAKNKLLPDMWDSMNSMTLASQNHSRMKRSAYDAFLQRAIDNLTDVQTIINLNQQLAEAQDNHATCVIPNNSYSENTKMSYDLF
ncbi:uncharacterized protein LOC142350703 isoform X3 [Convolutriloba macropyga]|uniref:uncharacterized protein LOC142350703 isoform X3 n=1 Tax=Convolutriloba macropyga TaxID=536237 RepID=UPI003F51D371